MLPTFIFHASHFGCVEAGSRSNPTASFDYVIRILLDKKGSSAYFSAGLYRSHSRSFLCLFAPAPSALFITEIAMVPF